jgi:undecaprenyl-diphosphatase
VNRATIRHIDDVVDSTFSRWRGHPLADRVFYGSSALGEFGLIWFMLELLRALRGGPNDERAAVRAVAAQCVESVLVNLGLKALFGRHRPASEIVHPHPFRQPLTSSFPSGHASAAFCAATVLSEQDDLALAYFALALVVSASRIHTKIHHASDVAAGAAIGTLIGMAARRIAPLPRRSGARGSSAQVLGRRGRGAP